MKKYSTNFILKRQKLFCQRLRISQYRVGVIRVTLEEDSFVIELTPRFDYFQFLSIQKCFYLATISSSGRARQSQARESNWKADILLEKKKQ